MSFLEHDACVGLTFHLADSLLREDGTEFLQDLLLVNAPTWSRRVRTVMDEDVEEGAEELDLHERGAVLRALERDREDESHPHARVMLAGTDHSLHVLIEADRRRFMPGGRNWIFANTLWFVARSKVIEGISVKSWFEMVTAAMARPGTWYMRGGTIGEFNAKNHGPGGYGPVAGIDVSKSLPGVYWANFFGGPYLDLIGRQALLSAPARRVHDYGTGIYLTLSDDPWDEETREYQLRESRVREHLGVRYFFDKKYPDRETVAPDFGLGPLPVSYPAQRAIARQDGTIVPLDPRH